MKAKTTVAGLILLGALSAYTFKVYQPAKAHKEEQAKFMQGTKSETFTSLEIKTKDENFTLRRKNDKDWQIEGLPHAVLDENALNSLLTSIEDLKLSDPIPNEDLEADLGTYGLKEPTLILKIKTDASERQLKFGETSGYTGERYVQEGETGPIYTSNAMVFINANKKKDEFRNRNPIEFTDANITSIETKSAANSLIIKQEQDARWKVSSPVMVKASEEGVSALIRSLRNLKVANFYDGAGSPVTIEDLKQKPDYTITLNFSEKSNPKQLVLRVIRKIENPVVEPSKVEKALDEKAGEPKEILYGLLNEGPSIYKIEGLTFSELDKPADSVRERKYFTFVTDDLDSARYSGEAMKALEIVQKKAKIDPSKPESVAENEWLVNGKKGDRAFVLQVLNELSNTSASDFPIENRDFGFAKPRFKAEVKLGTTTKTLVVGEIALKEGKEIGYYAQTEDLKEPFIISDETLKKISPREETLLKPEETASPSASATLAK